MRCRSSAANSGWHRGCRAEPACCSRISCHLAGVDSVVLETRSRAEIEATLRAGSTGAGSTVDLLRECGLGDRMMREASSTTVSSFCSTARDIASISQSSPAEEPITIYPQHELIRDLVKARLDAGGSILFEVRNVEVTGFPDGCTPRLRFAMAGTAHEAALRLTWQAATASMACAGQAVPAAARSGVHAKLSVRVVLEFSCARHRIRRSSSTPITIEDSRSSARDRRRSSACTCSAIRRTMPTLGGRADLGGTGRAARYARLAGRCRAARSFRRA